MRKVTGQTLEDDGKIHVASSKVAGRRQRKIIFFSSRVTSVPSLPLLPFSFFPHEGQ